MRGIAVAVVGALCLVAAQACTNAKSPPQGRWEGTFEEPGAMVVVRLEITPKGEILLSAPNATDIEGASADDRNAMRQRLAGDLVSNWASVDPRPFDFDGRIFRKPGGIAPQMEWDPDSHQMIVDLYLGMRPTIRIPMHAVARFSPNPWAA